MPSERRQPHESPEAEASTVSDGKRAVSGGAGAAAAWIWIPTLYFAEGVPNEVVAMLAGDMYALLGISLDQMSRYTGLLLLPWVVKPLWSPFVDVIGTQRRWIIGTQLALALGFLGVAFALLTSGFFYATLVCFLFIALCSATHDIAADGFYMAGLSKKSQAWFVGIRSTFYRGAKFFVSGVLLATAGVLSDVMPKAQAWFWTYITAAGLYLLLAIYHAFALPAQPVTTRAEGESKRLWNELVVTVTSFFRKSHIGLTLGFLLFYRFSEAQLGKISRPFMFADTEAGGLALEEEQVAVIYGTFGLLMLTIGGILGGIVIARGGLRRWMLPMALAINAPNACYLGLAVTQPSESWIVGLAVAVEMFGYGFGFAAYLMYMLEFSRGEHQTAHYAICTGFMALGIMLPSMIAGYVTELLGFVGFFWYILLATIPSFIVTLMVLPLASDVPEDAESEG